MMRKVNGLLGSNTAILAVVFLSFASILLYVSQSNLRKNKERELALFLKYENILFEEKITSYRTTLKTIQSVLNSQITSKRGFNDHEVKSVVRALLTKQSYIYDIFFALSPEYSQKIKKSDKYIYAVLKDKDFLSQNIDENQDFEFRQEEFFEGNYRESNWYKLAQKSKGIATTEIYYDAEYLKFTMFTMVIPLWGNKGEFAGMVGLDVPISVFLLENARRTSLLNYRVMFADSEGRFFEDLLYEDFNYPKGVASSEFSFQARSHVFSKKGQGEMSKIGATPRSFGVAGFNYVQTPIAGGKYFMLVMQDEMRLFTPLLIFLKGIFFALICALIIQLLLLKKLHNRIAGNISALYKSFDENISKLKKSKDEFEPSFKTSKVDIQEIHDLLVFWFAFLKEFHEALIISQEERKKSQQAADFQASFLANMSHEIRTPMNAIIGMIDNMNDTDLSEEQKELMGVFSRSAEGLMGILNDILDIAKIESGSMELCRTNMSLEVLLKDTHAIFKARADEKNVRLLTSIDEKVEVKVFEDPVRVKQIIFNLVSNAIKFTSEGEVKIEIELLEKQNWEQLVEIRISDTGIGMDEEQLSRIFQKFTQAEVSTTRRFGGTGLGLSIVKSLVEIYNGNISVESEKSMGSTFKVRLPFKYAKDTKEMEHQKSLGGISLTNGSGSLDLSKLKDKKLLVVDDIYENRRVVGLYLKSLGMAYEEADSGDAAINMYKQNHDQYDLILLDIQMPEKDGLQTLLELREVQREKGLGTAIFALSAYASSEAQEKYVKCGFDGYLVKPIRKDEFKNFVLNFFNSQKI